MDINTISDVAVQAIAQANYQQVHAELEAIRMLLGTVVVCVVALLGVSIWKR